WMRCKKRLKKQRTLFQILCNVRVNMRYQNQLRILKTICWMGAVADAFWALALLWPAVYVSVTGNTDLTFDLSTRLIMGIAASLMAGWACLLVWMAHNPVERRAIFLLTTFPVVTGLIIVTLVGIMNGNSSTVWILLKCSVLACAMLYGYYTAKKIAKGGQR
ncbi:MAG: hypothetical protein KKF12_04765, partial [Proteobacteria bacterium]|nr:hypothetical protein [Pseudomonadota bacterium]